jgi:hypothetical protein
MVTLLGLFLVCVGVSFFNGWQLVYPRTLSSTEIDFSHKGLAKERLEGRL